MKEDDFYKEVESPFSGWGPRTATREFNAELLEAISQGSIPEHPDIEVAVALAHLVRDEYELYGTSGSKLNNEDSVLFTRTLLHVLKRLGIESFEMPFHDFDSFRKYWRRNGGHGSWQVRREMVDGIFGPLHELLDQRETSSMTWTLATPISPHPVTGWPRVDEEIAEMRRHFNSATSQQDYSNVGNDCVAILEALSAVVYVQDKHGEYGKPEPSVSSTKARFDRFVEIEVSGTENSYIRKLARAAIELAQAVKHRRETATRTDAGIAADSVILLANIFRRLHA
ncbi:hypothetical protein [Glutamicibacter mishrai]|uniref:AbiJ N-terminal domain-containing protein n=1 Tax=Glutamicibacter mishrai TaxID=1775880 RepID=A0A6H0SJ48_9MICC|nr:hypothetical protein [Glutamicibacter mishrai]QIV87712.1 hypothetical protein D3791_11695 [Glutamicibacter mishrai]